MSLVEESSLSFKEGGSDKVYVAQLLQRDDGWAVRVEYGRRGGRMTEAYKVSASTEATARRVYVQTVTEKTNKGYWAAGVGPQSAPTQAVSLLQQTALAPVSSPRAVAPQAARTSPGPASASEAWTNPLMPPPCMLAEGLGSGADARAHLATLDAQGGWWGEVKLDGMRARVVVQDGRLVGIFPRDSSENAAMRFPELQPALLKALPTEGTFVLDGELGFLDHTGYKMDVQVLQGRARTDLRRIRLHASVCPMSFVIFDVLWSSWHGGSTLRAPWETRRNVLHDVVQRPSAQVRVIEPQPALVDLFDRVVGWGGEGIIAKRMGHLYHPGVRSKEWVKAKAPTFLERLGVCGLLEGEGSRATRFGALILCKKDETGAWVYWGEAGSGLSDEKIGQVMDATPALRVPDCPVQNMPKLKKDVLMWLDPEGGLTADIRFSAPTKVKARWPTVADVHLPGEA